MITQVAGDRLLQLQEAVFGTLDRIDGDGIIEDAESVGIADWIDRIFGSFDKAERSQSVLGIRPNRE